MNSNNLLNGIIFIVSTAVIIAMLGLIWQVWSSKCDVLQIINASITVKDIGSRSMIGLNADKDALKFGVVSPYTISLRKVEVQNAKATKVTVVMAGDLASWTTIDPSEFTLPEKKMQEVSFSVNVPEHAPDGNYTGTAVFCFRE